jgi:hypothetical protein
VICGQTSSIGVMEAGIAMTIKEVADLLFAARERIDFYWNFYVVVVIAVIGWIVSLKKTLSLSITCPTRPRPLFYSGPPIRTIIAGAHVAGSSRARLLARRGSAEASPRAVAIPMASSAAPRSGLMVIR